MIYYYIKHNELEIGLGCNSLDNLPENGSEITDKLYSELCIGINNDKRIYLNNDKPYLRDRHTKYDESTNSWIPDLEAIYNEKIQILKSQAQQELINTSNYSDPAYRLRLDDTQNKINDLYRSQLYDIIEGKTDMTELPINPNKKE